MRTVKLSQTVSTYLVLHTGKPVEHDCPVPSWNIINTGLDGSGRNDDRDYKSQYERLGRGRESNMRYKPMIRLASWERDMVNSPDRQSRRASGRSERAEQERVTFRRPGKPHVARSQSGVYDPLPAPHPLHSENLYSSESTLAQAALHQVPRFQDKTR